MSLSVKNCLLDALVQLTPVSTQENKHRIGLDSFPPCNPYRWMKKIENTTTPYHRIIGSNWNRKLVQKAHARFQFCSDLVRSHVYFLIWSDPMSGKQPLVCSTIFAGDVTLSGQIIGGGLKSR